MAEGDSTRLLTALEQFVLSELFAGRAELHRQLSGLRVASRDYTGIGVSVNFESEAQDDASAPARELWRGVHADTPDSEWGLGFIAYVERGRVRSFEGFTYGGEDWRDDVPIFTLRSDPAQR